MVFDAPPAQSTAHAWMPSSPCGPGCIDPVDEIGTARVVGRLLGVAGLLVSFPIVNVITPRGRREHLQRRYARTVLSCLGIRLRVVDNRTADAESAEARFADPGEGLLIVAGHIGWTDVVVLAAVQPLGFVARADMVDWPLLGGLAKLMRVIPIERERLRELPGVVARLGERLASGNRVAVFPEGTTWCGRAYGTMRPALFQAAVDTGTSVQPVRVRYLDAHGTQSTIPGFVGDDTFGTSAKRVLRSRGMVAEVVLEPVEYPGLDRRDLARRCEQAVRGADLSRHGVAIEASEWIEATATRVQDPESVEERAPQVVRRSSRLRPFRRSGRRGAGHEAAEGSSASV
ncbi:1-acyl-sn-glycerol-3-phosphate acyltransferase [Nocardia sp. NBC_00565]|nr:lysophospholipid acyltransferase family protein [Nocardia sp. NBC_00565]WUC00158.1 1-acyl-sn-glycerol-3-phosphate acyltransferase [Nocardia sp. NBC_00565]